MTDVEIVTATAEQVVRRGMSDRECQVVETAIKAIVDLAEGLGSIDRSLAIRMVETLAVGVIRNAVLISEPDPDAGGGS